MTLQEFSDQFDVLYNNISSNKAPGLNEYEKSVLLTKAQTELLLNFFAPESQGNSVKKGFDESIIRQADFSSLLEVKELPKVQENIEEPLDKRAYRFNYAITNINLPHLDPTDTILLPINEAVEIYKKATNKSIRTYQVIPITFMEYNRVMQKPFKRPCKWQAWKLFTTTSNDADNKTRFIEVILPVHYDDSAYDVKYFIRYIKRPHPIILEDLSYDNLSIEGFTSSTECELDSILHEQILQRAVELAKAAYLGDINASIETGKRSE